MFRDINLNCSQYVNFGYFGPKSIKSVFSLALWVSIELYYVSVYKLSKKNVHTAQEASPSIVRMMKYIWVPNKPNPNVVTSAPKRLLPKTIPFIIPKYLPYSFSFTLYLLNSLIIYPPWLTQYIAAPYPPKIAPTTPAITPIYPLKSGI